MKRRDFIATVAAVLTGRRLGRLVRPLQRHVNSLRSQGLDAELTYPPYPIRATKGLKPLSDYAREKRA